MAKMTPERLRKYYVGHEMCEQAADAWEADRKELHELRTKIYCAYCGQAFPLDDDGSPRLVAEHIEQCPKHPMQELAGMYREKCENLAALRGEEKP